MKVIQMLPTLSYGDGVGNDTIAFDKVLKRCGYSTKIYAENIDSRIPSGIVSPVQKLPRLTDRDVILYHLSTGTALNTLLSKLPARKVIIYHNITPPHFFQPYSIRSEQLCACGLKEAGALASYADYCLAVSEFNKQDLRDMGYQCPIDVLPILIPFEDYEKTPDRHVMSRFRDEYTNIIFVGRISPNKKQEDVIAAFYYYQKYINSKSRLIFVGSYSGMETYYKRLMEYVKQLDLKNCIFTGHISFPEILAYYKIADVFLCMSEHEGFCIPLVEAMYFQIPIIAYKSTGVIDTLGAGGILLEKKEPVVTAEMIHKIVTSKELKETILENQKRQIKRFSTETVEKKFMSFLENFIKE